MNKKFFLVKDEPKWISCPRNMENGDYRDLVNLYKGRYCWDLEELGNGIDLFVFGKGLDTLDEFYLVEFKEDGTGTITTYAYYSDSDKYEVRKYLTSEFIYLCEDSTLVVEFDNNRGKSAKSLMTYQIYRVWWHLDRQISSDSNTVW